MPQQTVKAKTRGHARTPADNIASIFTARRDLLQVVKHAIAGSRLTVEEADLLVFLYGVRELKWDDLPHDGSYYVPFKELEKELVHNPSLLSRRIAKLAAERPPLVEVSPVNAKKTGLHFNAQQVRITDAGVSRIKPVWEKYQQSAEALLAGFTLDDLKIHLKVNEAISERIRTRRANVNNFVIPD